MTFACSARSRSHLEGSRHGGESTWTRRGGPTGPTGSRERAAAVHDGRWRCCFASSRSSTRVVVGCASRSEIDARTADVLTSATVAFAPPVAGLRPPKTFDIRYRASDEPQEVRVRLA